MPQQSAGLLMYRRENNDIQFFLVHPGGPFFAKKDNGAWTIPKGLVNEGEDFEAAAKREFEEETGLIVKANLQAIGNIKMKSGKIVHAWMFEGEWDEKQGITSNTFPLEWPPRSGKFIQVPEADRAAWFSCEEAMLKINSNQQPFLTRAKDLLNN